MTQFGLLGNLYSHFLEYHSDQNQAEGFDLLIDFWLEHYGNPDHEHQDEEEHEQLPFKNFTALGFIFQIEELKIEPIILKHALKHNLKNQFFDLSSFHDSIDHPPCLTA